MQTKRDIVQKILTGRDTLSPSNSRTQVFAPSNIALCKYWGKRDAELNLPVTSSLSVSLGKLGTTTMIQPSDSKDDMVILDHERVNPSSEFYRRIIAFLELIPSREQSLKIETSSNIPTAAGLASSASGFAALVMCLNDYFQWQLSLTELSILARLGSGSACRSMWQGFVEWRVGERSDGMDSYGELIPQTWPDLCIGIYMISTKVKAISSRQAMKLTVATSPFYRQWPDIVAKDFNDIKQAIMENNFELLGKTAESNAIAMHATMHTTQPPIYYSLPETINVMHQIWQLRQQGLGLYFTQDAGPNLKLLFLKESASMVQENFPSLQIIKPFD